MKKYHRLLLFLALLPALSAAAATKYLVNDEQIQLLPLSNTGISGKRIREIVKYKVENPRPVPFARCLQNDTKKEGSLDFVSVPVELLEEAGVARSAAVRFGFPLPEGAVYNLDRILLRDAQNNVHPAQFTVGEKWSDGSLKWVHISFDAPLKAKEKAVWHVEAGKKISRTDRKGITYTENADKIIVNAGRIRATIDKKNFDIVKNLTLDGKSAGTFPNCGVEVQGVQGNAGSWYGGFHVPDRVDVIEAGPERMTVRVEGKYGDKKMSFMRYVARLHFRYNDTSFSLDYTHINDNIEREFTDMTLLRILFFPNRQPSGAVVGKLPVPLLQKTERTYLDAEGKLCEGALPGTAELRFGGEAGPSVAVADMAKRYPKGFRMHKPGDNNWLEISLLPKQTDRDFNSDLPSYLRFPFCEGKYRMKWGMSFTERIRFELAPDRAAINEAEASMPVVAVLPPAWYDKTRVYPGANRQSAEVDAGILKSFQERLKERDRNREYGFLSYGDSHGEDRWNWTNNEYDMANVCFMTFIRTGSRDIYRYALAAARHQADVDIIQAYADPYFVGGNVIHGPGHSGRINGSTYQWSYQFNYYAAACNGHTWARGMLEAWEMAGDTRVMDSAYLLGDHIALAMAPNFVWGPLGPMPRECGWALRAIVQLTEATHDPVYRRGADILAQKAQTTCNPPVGGIWPQLINRIAWDRGEFTIGNVLFITAVGLQGQCDYYRLTHDPKTLRCIRDIANWMVKAFDPEDGCGFAYDLSMRGRKLNYSLVTLNNTIAPPLAEAAQLLGDKKIAAIADRAMAVVMLRRPAQDGKFFAEYQSFLAEYLDTLPQEKKLDRDELLASVLATPGYSWHARINVPARFVFKLTSDKAKVTMQHWKWGVVPKKKDRGVTSLVVTKDGKEIEKRGFDGAVENMQQEFTFQGKPGDEFILEINDWSSADWSIDKMQGAVAGGEVDPKTKLIVLPRNGMRKIYFEIPEKGEVKVEYAGGHIGPFGMSVYDENGKKLQEKDATALKFGLSQFNSPPIEYIFKGNGKKRICSIVTWAESDANLKFTGTNRFSTMPDFFTQK